MQVCASDCRFEHLRKSFAKQNRPYSHESLWQNDMLVCNAENQAGGVCCEARLLLELYQKHKTISFKKSPFERAQRGLETSLQTG